MDLEDFRARRQRVIDAQSSPDWPQAALPGDVERQPDDSHAVPEDAEYTVGPGDRGWIARRWDYEHGWFATESVTAESESLALAWVWSRAASGFLDAWVRPAAQQADFFKRHVIRDVMRPASPRGLDPVTAAAAVEPRVDATRRRGVLRRAARDATGFAAVRVARNPRTPGDALRLLVDRTDHAVRWQVAGNPGTPRDVLDRLREEGDFGVRWYLALRPETTTEELVLWAREDSALWAAALDRADLTPQQLVEIDLDSSGSLRERVIAHPAADGDLLARVAAEADADLGVRLLRSGRLEPEAADALVERAVEWDAWTLRSTLRSGPDGRTAPQPLPLDRIDRDRLAAAPSEQHRMLALAATTEPEALHGFVADPSVSVRVLLAERLLSERTQVALVTDPSIEVRSVLARNSDASGAALGVLGRDPFPGVQEAAIANPAMPESALSAIAADGGPGAEGARRALETRIRPRH
ncbi:hypothetical protein [Amnibacterium setariae]|uniref:Uncharacterized protein n=1 Tax=Amnibacterium setariae TaxID=2306585 RepID=A0A3A1U289_9MICO|nr:hypothetical protein [Amnibacterium setariae]RIX30641.1 hypothetical protein D1781_04285 [Amnibacterium setariae]